MSTTVQYGQFKEWWVDLRPNGTGHVKASDTTGDVDPTKIVLASIPLGRSIWAIVQPSKHTVISEMTKFCTGRTVRREGIESCSSHIQQEAMEKVALHPVGYQPISDPVTVWPAASSMGFRYGQKSRASGVLLGRKGRAGGLGRSAAEGRSENL